MGGFGPNKSSMSITRWQSGRSGPGAGQRFGQVVTCDRAGKNATPRGSLFYFSVDVDKAESVFPLRTLETQAWVRWIGRRFSICCFAGPKARQDRVLAGQGVHV
jgi:hypothetical protein